MIIADDMFVLSSWPGLLGRLTEAVAGTDQVKTLNTDVRDKNEKLVTSIDLLPLGKSMLNIFYHLNQLLTILV